MASMCSGEIFVPRTMSLSTRCGCGARCSFADFFAAAGASARNVFKLPPVVADGVSAARFVGVGAGGSCVRGAGASCAPMPSSSSACSLTCMANFNAPSASGESVKSDVSSPSTEYRSLCSMSTMSVAHLRSAIPQPHMSFVSGESRHVLMRRNASSPPAPTSRSTAINAVMERVHRTRAVRFSCPPNSPGAGTYGASITKCKRVIVSPCASPPSSSSSSSFARSFKRSEKIA